MRYYGVPVQTKIQANTLLLQGNELSASNIIKAVKKQRRYITLEKETKEYLKACEAKSIVNQTNIKTLNDYVINRKTRSLNTTFLANSPIILDGLVLWLDAGVSDSYPAGGTVWKDLAGSNNGTLTNGPTFNGSNGGSIVFDGVDDFINITQNTAYQFSNTQAFSLNIWVRCVATSGVPVMFAYALTEGRGYYFTIDVNVLRINAFFFDYWDGSLFRGIQGNNNSITMNSWVNLVATSSSNSVNDMKVYQNGVLTSFTNRGTQSPSTINYVTLPMRIGARGDGGYFTGNISQVSIYNRALTPAEILQNYNATKGRFGLL